MISLYNTNENEFFRICFNSDKKEEYYETIRLELGDLVKISRDKLYNSIVKIPNKSIKNYRMKNKKIFKSVDEKPYVEKIGSLLINFLNTDFTDFDKAYDNFYSIYGFDFLYNYSIYEIYEDDFENEEEAYNHMKGLHKHGEKDLIKLQNNFKMALDFIFNLDNNEKYADYSNKTRLSACLISNKYYLKDFSSNIKVISKVNNYNYENDYNLDFDTILSEIDYNSFIINMIDVYLIDDIKPLLFIILQQMVSNDIVVKKCQICNKYFLPLKSNELYCEFVNEETNTICRDIGALQMYKKNLESIPGLLEYRRTYNKKSNEVSRNKENLELKQKFDIWKTIAQSKIKQYKHGIITEEELYEWMIENK